jgi:hypothetical protein
LFLFIVILLLELDVIMSTKPVIFAVVALLFLAVVLVYNNSSVVVFAVPREGPALDEQDCTYTGTDVVKSTCCWTEKERGPYPKIGTTEVKYCQTCYIDNDSGTTYCKPKEKQAATPSSPSGPLAPFTPLQEDGVLQPPTGQGAAPPLIQGQGALPQQGITQQEQPANVEQAQPETEGTPTMKNKEKLLKDTGDNVLEQQQSPQTGEELPAKKRGTNNDNSPTPPACPDKGPIPPNCTLKPKF